MAVGSKPALKADGGGCGSRLPKAGVESGVGLHRSGLGGLVGYGPGGLEFGFAGNAHLAADQPVDLGVKDGGTGFGAWRDFQLERKQDFILIAEVHQRTQRKPLGYGKLERTGADAVGQRPFHARRLAGIAGIFPIDVPAGFELEIEARIGGTP